MTKLDSNAVNNKTVNRRKTSLSFNSLPQHKKKACDCHHKKVAYLTPIEQGSTTFAQTPGIATLKHFCHPKITPFAAVMKLHQPPEVYEDYKYYYR